MGAQFFIGMGGGKHLPISRNRFLYEDPDTFIFVISQAAIRYFYVNLLLEPVTRIAVVLFQVIRRGYRVVEHPVTVRYHAAEGYTKMRGIRDWWRLFRPALLLRFGVKR